MSFVMWLITWRNVFKFEVLSGVLTRDDGPGFQLAVLALGDGFCFGEADFEDLGFVFVGAELVFEDSLIQPMFLVFWDKIMKHEIVLVY